MTLSSRTRAQFYLGKSIDKVEHEEIGTCARTELSRDADNGRQKIKLLSKFIKHTNFYGKNIFKYLLSQVFIRVHISQIFRFSP